MKTREQFCSKIFRAFGQHHEPTEAEVLHIIDEITEQALESRWQPIETAPKDGRPFLLWCRDNADVGYWSQSIWVTRPEGSSLGKQDGAWINSENRSDTVELRPSHWMPIPEPPARINQIKGGQK